MIARCTGWPTNAFMHLLSPGLRVEGHDVVYVAEATQQTKDIGLADEALRTGRILLTEDKDFGDLAFQEKRAVPGIVLLRFPSARRFMKWPQLKAAIEEHGEALYRGFTVVEEHRIRYWSLAGNGMSGGSSPGGVTSG